MPTRILRDGILTSEPVCSLSWAEEVFYRRLHSVADDHGRYYANPTLLRSACYPLQINKVSDSDVEKWLRACVAAALVRVYSAKDGKRYIEIDKFGQRVQSKSKYPDPPLSTDVHGEKPCGTVENRLVVDGDVFGDGDEKNTRPPEADALFSGVSPEVVRDFKALRRAKRAAITETAVDGIRKEAEKAGLTLEAALRMCCERGWQGFKAEWITESRARAGPVAAPGKTMTAIQKLEAMKHGLADNGNSDGLPETPLLGFGANAG